MEYYAALEIIFASAEGMRMYFLDPGIVGNVIHHWTQLLTQKSIAAFQQRPSCPQAVSSQSLRVAGT